MVYRPRVTLFEDRALPGLDPQAVMGAVYVELKNEKSSGELLDIICKIELPPRENMGALMAGEHVLILPSGLAFVAIEFWGDKEAWGNLLRRASEKIDRLWAVIDGEFFVTSDDKKHLISDCQRSRLQS